MNWSQMRANFVPHINSDDLRFNEKEFRSLGLSAYQSPDHLTFRLPTIESAIKFGAHNHTIPCWYYS